MSDNAKQPSTGEKIVSGDLSQAQGQVKPKTEHPIKTALFHANIGSPVRLIGEASGRKVEFELVSGRTVRATVNHKTLQLLQSAPADAKLLATFYFRTTPEGALMTPLETARIRIRPSVAKIEGEIEKLMRWSAAGKLVKLNKDHGTISLRIYPQHKKLEPFLISCIVSLQQLKRLKRAKYVMVTGTSRGSSLRAVKIEQVDLKIPEHWKDWTPPKSKAKKPNDDENTAAK